MHNMQQPENQKCFAREALKQLLNDATVQLIIADVRSPEEFAGKHIPGAVNIPLSELETRFTELSKTITIVTVCGKGGGRRGSIVKTIGLCKCELFMRWHVWLV